MTKLKTCLATALPLMLSMSVNAALTDLGDADLQQVSGQDGLSIVLSDNFGFRVTDIPGTGVTPGKANSIRFTAPRRTKYDSGLNYLDFEKDYVELTDLDVQTSQFAPITDPIKLDLVKLSDGRAAIQFKLPDNTSGLGKLSASFTVSDFAPVYADQNYAPTAASAPQRWTLGRFEINDVVQKGTKIQLSAAGDGYGWAVDTELRIGEIGIYPRFAAGVSRQDSATLDEWWKFSGIALCGNLTNDSCADGSRFKFGDSAAGAFVVKAENVDGKPSLTMTMGNVNVQAMDGAVPLAQGSIVVDSVTTKSSRCAGGMCDFGKQIIGDMKIYSMRIKFKDL
ncbi:DUF6160 family protein [Chitinivorax sp. PXF-14]|uniref:DUF6160 family protein n=1 Tax=Chitinivorax sp. PXF-14 TaxID=3230488 RepID=UPI003467927D